MAYEFILIHREEPIAVAQINRPQLLNALNSQVMAELTSALEELDNDDAIRCILLTGNARAFGAGADIKDMADATAVEMVQRNWIAYWDRIKKISKPVIAAVSGYAFGGGCELAMACDLIVASESAQFAQPEINIGVIPGAGGTQRLTRAIGKAKAMDMVLTGRALTAHEAEAHGLVARVFPTEVYLEEAKRLAHEIATKAPVAVRFAKEAVNKAYETPLADGLDFERKLFYFLFATQDGHEGMKAFVEKRKPVWQGK
ncbi:MAG: putative enoyl-CoA hydratase echA8 [Anaerolineae bacterium]|nr:putative enoyl-CoA hydratase echA8 [Anaerolineae bacterium]RIK33400.1 MAG: enoyl-CoA hydratase [Chloroflexota bacterium]